MYKWNPVFNLVMKLKYDYINTYGKLDTNIFEEWLGKLNKEEYNTVFEPLQVNQNNNILLIRYGIADMQDGFWLDKNSIYRECRSIVIDLENEEIVLVPFRKFFNLNEVDENKLENIQEEILKAKNIEITDKLDGSMQSARYYKDDIFMAGSMAIDKGNSWRLEDGYNRLSENHIQMLKDYPNYTFIFEYICLKDAHVVLYRKENEGLYLIGIRDTYTGKELTYSDIKLFSEKYNVPMTNMENKTLEDIIKESKIHKSSEKEGWVLLIEHYDGTIHRIKFKCDDYVHLHRLLDKISSINVIIQNIADNRYDDMISKIPDSYKNRVQQIANRIFEYKHNTEQEINKMYELSPKDDKKTFMIWVDTNIPKELNGYVKAKYLNKEYNVLTKGTSKAQSYKKLKDMGIYKDYSALFADLEE